MAALFVGTPVTAPPQPLAGDISVSAPLGVDESQTSPRRTTPRTPLTVRADAHVDADAVADVAGSAPGQPGGQWLRVHGDDDPGSGPAPYRSQPVRLPAVPVAAAAAAHGAVAAAALAHRWLVGGYRLRPLFQNFL